MKLGNKERVKIKSKKEKDCVYTTFQQVVVTSIHLLIERFCLVLLERLNSLIKQIFFNMSLLTLLELFTLLLYTLHKYFIYSVTIHFTSIFHFASPGYSTRHLLVFSTYLETSLLRNQVFSCMFRLSFIERVLPQMD